MYKKLLRPIFFLLNPEKAHHLVVWFVKSSKFFPFSRFLFRKIFEVKHESLCTNVWGLNFKNPVGLAAGFDKNADFFAEFSGFGFSFIEIGTVTPEAQLGNPKPRLFRLISDNGLINRMGFNNKGINYVKKQLEKKKKIEIIIGGNIGKNTSTPNEMAINDYILAFNGLYNYVDYIAINISCPNVSNLRELQSGKSLSCIIEAILKERLKYDKKKPVLLKVSPDLNNEQLTETLEIAEILGIDGYIATNTTTSRDGLITNSNKITSIGNGGLSGKPLTSKSTEVIRVIHDRTKGTKPIIGVGGIFTTEDAIEKLEAGASLIQIYSGFIYEGPFIVKRINKGLVKYYTRNYYS
ncbi:MAG TPA: quinone-dependent dihydroorotate dehydrogenase [Tenuifilaceae bacterium]|nr:quinone-dependent dihydroorotate dehydrogenase [Tenuifilaceae bacterium]